MSDERSEEGTGPDEGPIDTAGMPGGAPPATFEFLVHTLFTQALMALCSLSGQTNSPVICPSALNWAMDSTIAVEGVMG